MVIFRTDLYPAALELKYDNFKSVPGIAVSSWSTYALAREKYSIWMILQLNRTMQLSGKEAWHNAPWQSIRKYHLNPGFI